ncbi:hypothetical protein [Prosthecobacter sp.]|uniref:hypothetical protein n=1 Tax=Prosthecobacter sp. TaxID=1965333 RepID=UPI002ABAC2EC|nr:hypothetical protein [Prosthecobacter sp.]MDZ4403509.1 hypothetical protein [Prosthecobacter sp.]
MKALLLVLTAALTLSATAAEPVNSECPVCHKDVRLIFHSQTKDGKRVAFATAECKGKYDRTPGKYPVKPKS